MILETDTSEYSPSETGWIICLKLHSSNLHISSKNLHPEVGFVGQDYLWWLLSTPISQVRIIWSGDTACLFTRKKFSQIS